MGSSSLRNKIVVVLAFLTVIIGMSNSGLTKSKATPPSTAITNATSSQTIDPACFRIEGTNMNCTGGGSGSICTETCGGKFPNAGNVCDGVAVGTICDSVQPRTCYGSKCCDTCASKKDQYCGNYTVCGQACTGGTQTPDCSKLTCPVAVLGKGVPYTSSSPTGCTPGFDCSEPQKDGDGCDCTCSKTATSCVPKFTPSKCTICNCGKVDTCTPNPPAVICTVNQNEDCIKTINYVPMVANGPCGCKCPSTATMPSLPYCGTCQ